MGKAKVAVWVLATQVSICFLIWRNIQDSKMTGRSALAFCLTAFFSGVALLVLSETSRLVGIMEVIGAGVLGNIANIVYDLFRDSTSHNLFPFELVLTTFLSLVGASIAAGASAIWRKSNSARFNK